jgi:hypothetical protein
MVHGTRTLSAAETTQEGVAGPHEEGQTTRDLSGDTVRLLTLAAGPWPLVPGPSGHSTRGAQHGALVSWYMVAPTSRHSIPDVQGAGKGSSGVRGASRGP